MLVLLTGERGGRQQIWPMLVLMLMTIMMRDRWCASKGKPQQLKLLIRWGFPHLTPSRGSQRAIPKHKSNIQNIICDNLESPPFIYVGSLLLMMIGWVRLLWSNSWCGHNVNYLKVERAKERLTVALTRFLPCSLTFSSSIIYILSRSRMGLLLQRWKSCEEHDIVAFVSIHANYAKFSLCINSLMWISSFCWTSVLVCFCKLCIF